MSGIRRFGQLTIFVAEPLPHDLTELRSIEDWTLEKEFKSVPNVVDVSDFGGSMTQPEAAR
jgi:Cu/Ag efflux pump CusA